MMKKLLLLAAAMMFFPAVSGVFAPVRAQAPDAVTLVVPDVPVHVLRRYSTDYMVRPLSPELTQAAAAERLAMLIERATGARPAIVPAGEAPVSGLRIFVGYGPHLEGRVSPPEEPEGVMIAEVDGDLFILGEIAPAGVNNWPAAVDRGLMHAVETFAERVMGYRFLNSTPEDEAMFELGTVVPGPDALAVAPGLLIEEAPVFRHRLISTRPRPLIGLRACSAVNFSCNHSYGMNAWARAYGESHPEMFVPIPVAPAGDGAQVEAMDTRPDLRFLDYTEPLVLEKRLEHLQAWFDHGAGAEFFDGRTPSDTYIIEEPPDWPAPSFRYNERSRALWNPDHGQWGDFSAIWFDYLRRLAGEAGQRWPGMRVSALAYLRHYQPPAFDLPDNLDVMLALQRSSAQNKEPDVYEKNLAHLRRWSEKLGGDRDRLLLWEYGCWPDWFVAAPLNYPFAMQRWLREIRPYVSGVFIEHYGPAEVNFLMRRLWLRLLWDPDLDVAAEIDDVCARFFGPAGDSMAAFHRLLTERYEMRWENPRLIWDQYYVAPELYYGQSFPPRELARLAALLEQARREAGLPAGIEAEARHGSAVYFFNDGEAAAPVAVTLAAGDRELVDPAVGWAGGRLSWRGRLGPGERLEVNPDGRAFRSGRDGSRAEAVVVIEGRPPAAAPGAAEVFHFWHAGDRAARFRVSLRRGGDPAEPGAAGGNGIYARRLAWVRDAYLVFHPADRWSGEGHRGFFVDAHVAHRHLGAVPVLEAPAAAQLPAGPADPAWEDVPAAELVRGRENGSSPWQIMGYPADRRTRVAFVSAPGALAVRFEAEGPPAEGEKVTLRLGDAVFEFPPGPDAADGRAAWRFQDDGDSWHAVAAIPWAALGFEAAGRPGTLPVQVTRVRGGDSYILSPPLAMWGDREQGPGQLRLRAPAP